MSPSLDWGDHVSAILGGVNSMLYGLRLHRRALNFELRKHLVESLIFPHFDYACSVYNDLYQVQDTKLQRAVNACVRFVWGSIGRREHVTQYRLELNWLSTRYRREYLLGTLAYTIIAYNTPAYLASEFKRTDSDVCVRASSRLPPRSLVAPIPRTEAFKQSFVITASFLINILGHVVFSVQHIPSFKIRLFNVLLARDRGDWERRVELEGIVTPPVLLPSRLH